MADLPRLELMPVDTRSFVLEHRVERTVSQQHLKSSQYPTLMVSA
jgi:hypothetical protein